MYFQFAKHQNCRDLINGKLLDWFGETVGKSSYQHIPNCYVPIICVFDGWRQSQDLHDFCKRLVTDTLTCSQHDRAKLQAFVLAVLLQMDSSQVMVAKVMRSLSGEEKLQLAKRLAEFELLAQESDAVLLQGKKY